MSSPSRRRTLQTAGSLIGSLLAGCLSTNPPQENDGSGADCKQQFPSLPSAVSADQAKSFAENYEATVVRNRICRYPQYGLGATTAERYVSLDVRSKAGYFVFVQQPYWYNTGETEADGVSSGIYFIDDSRHIRINHHDAEHQWVESIASRADPNPESFDLRLFNFSTQEETIRFELRSATSSGSAPLLAKSSTIAAEGGTRLTIVVKPETYEFVVKPGDANSQSHEFDTDGGAPTVYIYTGPSGETYSGLWNPFEQGT